MSVQPSKASDFKIDIAADLHKWRAFVAIGELGSLTRAALFLATSAVGGAVTRKTASVLTSPLVRKPIPSENVMSVGKPWA